MKRRLLLIAVMVLAPSGAVVYWVQPPDPINAGHFDRIHVGMTQQEVEDILGGPGGEIQEEIQGHIVPGQWLGSRTVWYGRQNAIIIRFKSQGDEYVVGSKEIFNPGVWDRLKAWWGGYELDPFPVGGWAKRLEPAA